MNKNLFVDINVLQTVPSSNINRDDTGSPKTAIYGGVTRSRVSSQSWKRAIRLAFDEDAKNAEWLKSYRTLKIVQLLSKKLQELNSELSAEDATEKAVEVFKAAGLKPKKDSKTGEWKTSALFFISEGQLEKLAQFALENDVTDKEAKKEIKSAIMSNESLDLALFGRMAADNADLNVDASSQVAHAISTHEIVPEFDYYTAVDDAQNSDETGSAMIGTIEYNSSTLYRYANVNVKDLVHNLGNQDLAIEGIKLYIKDFLMSMPTGKENTFANKTVPQYVLINVRTDTPVNLVSAFEEPVKSKGGYIKPSIEKLEKENADVEKFVDDPVYSIVLTSKDSKIDNQANGISELIDTVADKISQELNNENIDD